MSKSIMLLDTTRAGPKPDASSILGSYAGRGYVCVEVALPGREPRLPRAWRSRPDVGNEEV